MATKLTLRMDERRVEEGKEAAERAGKSVSRLVADYFELLALTSEDEEKTAPTPVTDSLFGIAAGSELDEVDYRRHLDDKHR